MKTAAKISVTANGRPYELDEGRPLAGFLEELGFAPGMVVVERNREALTPSETRETVLRDGDRLEIVQITAGG